MLTAAAALLATHTAIGMLLAAAVARAPTRPNFHRLSLLVAFAGLAFGLGLRWGPAAATLPPLGVPALAAIGLAALSAAAFGIGAYVSRSRGGNGWLAAAAVAGAAGVLLDPALLPAGSTAGGVHRVLYAIGMATTGPALGGVLFAMLLAHWYLVEPRLPTAPLRNVLLLFAAAEIVNLMQLAGLVAWHWPEWAGAEGGLLRSFILGDALFVAMRAFLGVLAPLGLIWMTWKTVEIRSIQSATGILYAAIVFAIFGETISVYLSLATGQPF